MKFSSSYFLLIYCVQDVFSLTTIETIPPTPNNVSATNYSGLVVRAMFEKTTSTTNCGWRYNGDTIPLQVDGTDVERFGGLQFHIVGIGCVNRTTSRQSITCVERDINGATHIITNLTYIQPLTSDLVLAVRCNNGADLIIELPTKTVRDCPHNFPNGVIASTSKFDFNATGTFACNNNGILFYSNGSRPTLLPSHTTCLYTAEWSEQEAIQDLQCWTAPVVTLGGNSPIVDGIEGGELEFTCTHSDVIPVGNSSNFYYNGNSITKNKNDTFKISNLSRSDNNKEIYCQAITPYTILYNETGKSNTTRINVQYISNSVSHMIFPGTFVIIGAGGYLVRSDQTLSMNCSSYGKPTPSCAFTICSNGSCDNITNTGNRCIINGNVTKDGSVHCLAFNVAGSRKSSKKNITLVSSFRKLLLRNKDGNLESNSIIIKRNEMLQLFCNIDNAIDLNTNFKWIFPEGHENASPELTFLAMHPTQSGNYTCVTDDAFGNFSRTTYIDVIYAPTSQTPVTCNWKVNESETCNVTFISNPQAVFISVIKENITIANSSFVGEEVLFSTSKYEQVFIFKRHQVTQSDAGIYILNLNSTISPFNHHIEFDITVTSDGRNPNPPSTNTLVIALSASGGISLLLVLVVVLRRCKPWENKRKQKGGTSSHENQAFHEDGLDEQSTKNMESPLHATSSHTTDNDAVYAAVVKKNKKTTASKKKEEKFNPIYATSANTDANEPAYGVVDKTRKKKQKASTEKEEKSNPLYASSSHTERVEPAYGVVDKSNKKKTKASPANKQAKNAQKASLQPANQTEETYAAVDRKKKKATVRKASQGGAGPSTSKDHVEEAYGEVEKKHNQNNPTEQDSVYAEVRKPKKKKKKPQITQQSAESEGTSSAFHDVTLHGTTQQE